MTTTTALNQNNRWLLGMSVVGRSMIRTIELRLPSLEHLMEYPDWIPEDMSSLFLGLEKIILFTDSYYEDNINTICERSLSRFMYLSHYRLFKERLPIAPIFLDRTGVKDTKSININAFLNEVREVFGIPTEQATTSHSATRSKFVLQEQEWEIKLNNKEAVINEYIEQQHGAGSAADFPISSFSYWEERRDVDDRDIDCD